MMDITLEVLSKANELSSSLLNNYNREINEAYLAADDELAVGLRVIFKPEGDGVGVQAEISFIASRVKDKARGVVKPHPQGLLWSNPATRERPCGNTPGTWIRYRSYCHR